MEDAIKETPLVLSFEQTSRGFGLIKFADRYAKTYTLQESSLATERAIWLGAGGNRMHLTQNMVRDLLPLLEHFVKVGYLPDGPKDD